VGNRRFYQSNPEALRALHAYLDRFWTQALDAFKTAVEQSDDRPNDDQDDDKGDGT